jgi:DNA-binding NarL/FixJ family response regulator
VDSAKAALAHLSTHPVDLVICDVMMPEIDGFQFCQQVKEHAEWRFIPVILLTALDDESDMVKGFEAGADEFLTKPVNKFALRARVRVLLRVRERYRELIDRNRPPTIEELVRRRIDGLATEMQLSAREREVLDLLLLGRNTDEIGIALQIAARTAKFHQANVLQKLGVDSRHELLRIFL